MLTHIVISSKMRGIFLLDLVNLTSGRKNTSIALLKIENKPRSGESKVNRTADELSY